MASINPSKPYPGTECIETPRLQRLLDHFQTVEVYNMIFFRLVFNLNFSLENDHR